MDYLWLKVNSVRASLMKLSWSYQSNCVYTCISYFSLYVNISVTVEPIIMIIIIITIIIIKKIK